METEKLEKLHSFRLVYPDEQVKDEKLSPKPLGLEPLLDACRGFYPDQPQPFQFIPKRKSWRGIPCPLDSICVYRNFGNPAEDIAPHWYYIGFSSSDIYGAESVHKISKYNSGYGIELTFRLKSEPDEYEPPFWPASMMRVVATAVFQNNYVLSPGKLLCYGFPFDEIAYSNIKDLLLSKDPQLGTVKTPFGLVTFLQLVGVCEKEFKAAWQQGGQRVIEVMTSIKGAGGPWLITDMRRNKTIFELDSSVQKHLKTPDTWFDYLYRYLCRLKSDEDESSSKMIKTWIVLVLNFLKFLKKLNLS